MTEVEGSLGALASQDDRERALVARHPQLRAMLAAEAMSATGDAVFWVGLLVWLLERPHGTGLIALAALARLGPRVVFGAAGGVLADRYDRRVLLVTLDLARSVLMVALAFLVDANGSASGVLALVLLTYVLATPYRPAFTAGSRSSSASATPPPPTRPTAPSARSRPSWARCSAPRCSSPGTRRGRSR